MGKKFDICIMNPPFDKSLHLSFLDKIIDISNKTVIVQPSTWLISHKTGGKEKIYNNLKGKINNHVESVEIENLNKEFNIALYVPCSITTINMNKNVETIDFNCFGHISKCTDIYNCNLIGNDKILKSILNKINNSKFSKMKEHIFSDKVKITDDMYFAAFQEIVGRAGCCDPRTSDAWFKNDYYTCYFLPCYNFHEPISHTPIHSLKNGRTYNNPAYSDKLSAQVYGTEEELKNWVHFIMNNKLSVFINIVFTIDQNCNSKNNMPFVNDKKYTDEELYKLFDFNKEEIELINNTCEKFKRNNKFFRRYVYGEK